MTPIAVIFTITYGILSLVKSILDYKLKRKILDKDNIEGVTFPSFAQEEANYDKIPFLKWGLIILFAGIGLIIIEVLGYNINYNPGPLPFGIVLVSVALGFLTYFGIMQTMFKDKEK
ncbi:hypothetical protein [Reichenbachiella sp. MALMAid0571]|uniref:hypothetical protein n=1 Tax=Reichenbachiella sp. MALMAid0571 TaxID=3143939 RepID=UPI0032E02435